VLGVFFGRKKGVGGRRAPQKRKWGGGGDAPKGGIFLAKKRQGFCVFRGHRCTDRGPQNLRGPRHQGGRIFGNFLGIGGSGTPRGRPPGLRDLRLVQTPPTCGRGLSRGGVGGWGGGGTLKGEDGSGGTTGFVKKLGGENFGGLHFFLGGKKTTGGCIFWGVQKRGKKRGKREIHKIAGGWGEITGPKNFLGRLIAGRIGI